MLQNGRYQIERIYLDHEQVIDNGIIGIENGVVVQLDQCRTPTSQTKELGNVAIVPGLVNAHTHLEFSALTQPVGDRGMPLTHWLKLVIEQRVAASQNADSKGESIVKGIRESLDSGVVAIGEIATTPVNIQDYQNERCAISVFHECLTRNQEQIDNVKESNETWLNLKSTRGVKAVSPHAPYSVHPNLLTALVEQANQYQCPIAMHIAESKEEIELLENGSGPFVDFLQSLGVWCPESFSPRFRIMDYLVALSRSPRSLIVHANYLTDAETEFVAQHSNQMSIVYCPRTHDYFAHDPYPLETYISAGINVAIGTDSRASNPDLSVVNELVFLKQKYGWLSDSRLLKMGTSAGQTALGMHNAPRIGLGSKATEMIVLPYSSRQGLFGSEIN